MQSEAFTSDSSTQESGDDDTEVSLTFKSDDGEVLELEYESEEVAPDAKTMGSPETGVTKTYYRVDGSFNDEIPVEDDSEDTSEDSNDDTDEDDESDVEYTCAGKDGECSRTVEDEGGYCWQHGGDDDS